MELILPDVNVLVYAFQVDAPDHRSYAAWLNAARASQQLALAEAALLGAVRLLTDSRVYPRPVGNLDALALVDSLRATPGAVDITATRSTWMTMRDLLTRDRRLGGRRIPDAWLAALAISHGARLATADRGFARFDGLDWFDPVAA